MTDSEFLALSENRNYWAEQCRLAWADRDTANLAAQQAERALAEVTKERDRLRAQLEWTKAAIERNGNPRERDDMTMHRLNGVLAEVYAGVAGALATTEQQEEQG